MDRDAAGTNACLALRYSGRVTPPGTFPTVSVPFRNLVRLYRLPHPPGVPDADSSRYRGAGASLTITAEELHRRRIALSPAAVVALFDQVLPSLPEVGPVSQPAGEPASEDNC